MILHYTFVHCEFIPRVLPNGNTKMKAKWGVQCDHISARKALKSHTPPPLHDTTSQALCQVKGGGEFGIPG